MKRILFKKEYHGFESTSDLDRDISEMWDDADLPGEFMGTVKVTVEYHDIEAEMIKELDDTLIGYSEEHNE